jgi:hypothetical protein
MIDRFIFSTCEDNLAADRNIYFSKKIIVDI